MIPVTLIADVAKSSGILPSSVNSQAKGRRDENTCWRHSAQNRQLQGRDWQDETDDLVGDQTPCLCKPGAQAYKHVAPNTLKEQPRHVGGDLSHHRGMQNRKPDPPPVQCRHGVKTAPIRRAQAPRPSFRCRLRAIRTTSIVDVLLLPQAITMRLLPVNSSAPPINTIASPRENTKPPTTTNSATAELANCMSSHVGSATWSATHS
jgi:hypothetical protein